MKTISLSHLYSSVEIAVRKIILVKYDPTLIVVSTSSLLNISNGYCLFNQRNGIHTLANSFHVCRCQSEGVEVFWFSYLSFTDDKEGLFNQP